MSESNKVDPQQQPIPQGYFMPIQQPCEEVEIDLFELWQVLWKQRIMIIAITMIAAFVAIIISLSMPNYYKAEVVLAPVSEQKGGGGLASALGGLGGLASMAGVSLGGGGNIEENLAVLKSREFLWQFIDEKKLMPILFDDEWDPIKKVWLEQDPTMQPSQWDAYRKLIESGVLSVSSDKKSGLITVGIEWTDAAIASRWANELVERLNQYLRDQAIERSKNNLKYLNEELNSIQVADMRQTLFELISNEQKKAMLANTQKEFAFRVIDPALEPDKKSKPKRSLIVILATILGGMGGVLIAFVQNAITNRKAHEEVTEGV